MTERKRYITIGIIFIFLCSINVFAYAQDINVSPDPVPENANDISPLLIGEKIPHVAITALHGEEISLQSVVGDKPAILIFYRGSWCPYCNAYLAELQEIEDEVLQLGYEIVAISPDDAQHLQKAIDKNSLKYQLYSDSDMMVAKAFGIAFQAPDRHTNRLADDSSGKNPGWLPVPSVFVVNQDGLIEFEYINPNYKVRITGDLLLAVLRALKK